jgi:hypothetical protein
MSVLGNSVTQQSFTPAVDVYSGNGSTVAFTLSRPVASVAQVEAFIENVPQSPVDAFTVNGNIITFTSAPPSGSSNIYVRYTSPITQVIAPSDGTVGTNQLVTGAVTAAKLAAGAARANLGSGAVLKVQNFYNPGSATSSNSYTNLQSNRFSYTPVSTNSTLWLTHSAYTYMNPSAGFAAGSCYGYWGVSEYNGSSDVRVSDIAYIWNYQYSSTYMQSIGAQSTLQWYSPNTALTPRLFSTVGAVGYGGSTTLTVGTIYLTVVEVAN